MVIALLRLVHTVLCLVVENKLRVASVPLETMWTHIVGREKRVTHRFGTMDEELRDLASVRNDIDDGDEILVAEVLVEDTEERLTNRNSSEMFAVSAKEESLPSDEETITADLDDSGTKGSNTTPDISSNRLEQTPSVEINDSASFSSSGSKGSSLTLSEGHESHDFSSSDDSL